MPWTVVLTDTFSTWLDAQADSVRNRILAATLLIRDFGPSLGRPQVDTLKGSGIANLKELRVSIGGSPYRILFAFDPIRQAVILCGGDKSNDKRFYRRMISIAEAAFEAHIMGLPRPEEGASP